MESKNSTNVFEMNYTNLETGAKYNFKETMTRSGNGLLLCSYKIGFKHPKTHKKMEFEIRNPFLI